MSDWVMFTKRTDDPKLADLELRLGARGIQSRRSGRSFHAPILQVRKCHEDKAWDVLTGEVDGRIYDDIPDDDPIFGEEGK